MEELVSEPLTPLGGFDTAAMATGVAGLPTGFAWRGVEYTVVQRLETWKQSGPEIGRLGGERYLRRHCFRVRMSDGTIWTVYCLRHTPRGGSPKRRWFLYSIERP